MKRFFIFLLLAVSTNISFSQDEYTAFGKADIKELLLKECSFEKDADAMKLLDYQETEITTIGYDVRIKVERRIRIKIFSKDGADAANIIIPYIRQYKKSKISDVSAYIFNLDPGNSIITQKLEKDQIFKERSDEGLSTISFTFPNVKPGSVIEYRYTQIQKNSLHIDPWYFQSKLPTAVSVCKFIYPGSMRFDYRFITTQDCTKELASKYGKSIRTFTLKDVTAFRPEPLMSSIKDNLQRVEFAYLPPLGFSGLRSGSGGHWGFFNTALLSAPFFGEQIEKKIQGTESILDSAKKIASAGDKVHFIYKKVRSTLKWDETMSFYADDLNEIWKTRSANSAEINLTILNLLKKSGIKAYPILISTRENGRPDPEFTSLGQFNSVDVLIADNSEFFILDGTQKYISYKTPPYNILNRDAFLIDENSRNWITIIDDRVLMKTNIAVKATLNDTGELKGDATISFFDHSKASKLAEQNKNETEDDRKEFIEKEPVDLVLDNFIEENADDELLPLIHKFGFTSKLSNTDAYYFLDPFFLSNFRTNPFNDSLRRTDIDMGSNQSYSTNLHVTIPEGFLIDALPKNLFILSSDSSMLFKREIIQEDNVLVIKNSFNIQRTVYTKQEYFIIREYFRKVYNTFSDQIVLKKKN